MTAANRLCFCRRRRRSSSSSSSSIRTRIRIRMCRTTLTYTAKTTPSYKVLLRCTMLRQTRQW